MPSPLPLPVTLITACIMTLFYLALAVRVVRGRTHQRILLGDGGNPDLRARVRIPGNFIEYVPLALILMGLLETSSVNSIALTVIGGLLILVRILHVFGVTRKAPNLFRVGGAGSTFLLLAVLAVWVLVLAFTA